MLSKCGHLHKSRSFGSLQVSSIQMCQHSAKEEKCQLCPACVPTDVVVKCHLYGERAKKATVAAHQSGKGFNTIPKKSKIHH